SSNVVDIIRHCFSNGSTYEVESINDERVVSYHKAKNPCLTALYVAMELSCNRYIADFMEHKITSDLTTERRMLTSLALGLIPYFEPKNPEQKSNPVPIGQIDFMKLFNVLTNLVLSEKQNSEP